MKKHRVAILTEIISPYRIPVFNALAEDPDIELDVLFFAETESRRSWQIPKEKIRFSYKVLKGIITGRSAHDDSIFFNPLVVFELIKGRHDTIIVGGFHHPTAWLALVYAYIARKRLLLHSESTLEDKRSGTEVKERLKRFFVRHSSGYIVPGTPQRRYLLSLGAKRDNIWKAPNSVDTELFSKALEEREQQKEEIKEKLGIRGTVMLYVGRMIDAKGVKDLIEAFMGIQEKHSDANLVLVGEGPDMEKYEKFCLEKKIPRLIFTGFKDQEELPQYYAIADIFVFPTHTDPWGLVINEAMLSGLPVVCSQAAGAAEDLVKHGLNGFLHKSGDIDAIRGHICRLLGDRERRDAMGRRSREIINGYTPANMALGIKKAIFAKEEFV